MVVKGKGPTAGASVSLERKWPLYFDPTFRPSSKADRWRVALLAGETVSASGHSEGAHLSGEVTKLERLGYDVARLADGGYQIRNLDHRPTAEQFAALRRIAPTARENGSGPSLRDVVAGMLPGLGDRLTVTMVGFDGDGKPTMIATGESGWRFTCAVDRAEPPRS